MSNREEALIKKYLKYNGQLCPVCNSNDLSAGTICIDADTALQAIDCSQCCSTWTDLYTLTTIEQLNIGADFAVDELVTVRGHDNPFAVVEVVSAEKVKVRKDLDSADLTVNTDELTAYVIATGR